MITRRSAFAFFAAAFAAPIAAYAQVGALPSSTAPSNSEGTPSGGSGVIGRTQVEPVGRPVQVARRRRRHHHRRHHRAYS